MVDFKIFNSYANLQPYNCEGKAYYNVITAGANLLQPYNCGETYYKVIIVRANTFQPIPSF